jgi:hypothetical protein
VQQPRPRHATSVGVGKNGVGECAIGVTIRRVYDKPGRLRHCQDVIIFREYADVERITKSHHMTYYT